MYAPLQQAWTREVILSACWMERYLKALMVFLASFSLLGWTYALIALGLFCAYQKMTSSLAQVQLHFSPEIVRWQAVDSRGQGTEVSGRPKAVAVGWCYISWTLRQQHITVWQWQLPDDEWRRLRAIAMQVWIAAR